MLNAGVLFIDYCKMKYPNTRWLKNSQFVVSCTSMDQESGDS